MTPEEAVEAASKVLDHHLPDSAHESGCALRCGYSGDELSEHLVKHILEAAAPHLMAAALEEAASAIDADPYEDLDPFYAGWLRNRAEHVRDAA